MVMSIRDHRLGRPRKQIPVAFKRREGPHFVRTKFEPIVCGECFGTGTVFDAPNNGDAPVKCMGCGGEGEI